MTSATTRCRIGVDGYNLAMPRGTGVATYARTLCHAITDLGRPLDLVYGVNVPPAARTELRESLFFAQLGEMADAATPPKLTPRAMLRRAFMLPRPRDLVDVPRTGRVIAEGFAERLPASDRLFTRFNIFTICARYFRRYGRFMPLRMPDPPPIMHWTYPLPLTLIGARNIYTIHDLVPLRLPYTSLEDKRYYDALIRGCIDRAAKIVTVSETSRRDILDLFPSDPAHVVNTFQPTDMPEAASDAATLTRRLDRLFDLKRDGYLLYFGAIEPKKNLGRLIEAYLGAELETPLVIVGGRGWRSEQELRLLGNAHGTSLKAARLVRQIDYLPRPLLIELVRGARAVLFPSLYEGFGLPALEALALGVPLLASTGGSLPEVVGDAALSVDPYDVPAIGAALQRLDRDDALRARLAAAGPAQARKFSKARYRTAIDALYTAVAG